MSYTGLSPAVVFIAGFLAIVGIAGAAEPCGPFEGGRVDAQFLQVMRDAAKDGRLYRVDPAVSKVGFCVKYFPFQEFHGEFTNIVGGLAFSPQSARQGQALLLIHTTSLESDNSAVMPLVKGHDFIDTGHYPEILFVGHAVHLLNEKQGHVHGELTLRGITRPVVFKINLRLLEKGKNQRPGRIFLGGRSQVDRMAFDMNSYRYVVSESVRLCLSLELVPWGQ